MITINQAKLNESLNLKARKKREEAYRNESDPVYFQWQRGEATEQEYLAKVEEIRSRFPYV